MLACTRNFGCLITFVDIQVSSFWFDKDQNQLRSTPFLNQTPWSPWSNSQDKLLDFIRMDFAIGYWKLRMMCRSYCRLIHLKWPSPCLWATWLKCRLDSGRISEWRRICLRDPGAVTVFGDLLLHRVYHSLTWENFVRSSKSIVRLHNPHMDWELRKRPIFRILA